MPAAVQQQFWVVVPAAGSGQRLGASIPKQFLDLAGRPVIAHTLDRLLSHPRIAGVQLAIDPAQPMWSQPQYCLSPRLRHCTGGGERMDSVLAGLLALPQQCLDQHMVLVHDAARPLLGHAELDRLLAALDAGADGAVLGLPVADSLKRADEHGRISAVVDRDRLWRALTPQAFRRGALILALQAASAAQLNVTDESQAMSMHGVAAVLVSGDPRNIKITTLADLELARVLVSAIKEC